MTELDLIVCAIKNIQSSTELSGNRFTALTESLHVAALTCDACGRITSSNQHSLRVLHTTAAEVKNLYVTDLLGGEELNLAQRLKFRIHIPDMQLIDAVLLDARGQSHRVAMVLHRLDKTRSRAAGALIILVPDSKRCALRKALNQSGAAADYVSYFLSQAQEAERKRIASDLHDGLGQVLTMLKFRVEESLIRLASDQIEEVNGILKEVVIQLRGAVGDVRRISTELRPSMLDDLGLVPTVVWLCRQFEATHAGIKVTLDEKINEESIPIPVKIPIFRLIQEALNNIAKHAHATNVFIYLRVHHNGFLVEIVDNGVGFDSERLTNGASCLLGVGINSMRDRVEGSHGTFRIRSYAGTGTAISAVWGPGCEDVQWQDLKIAEDESDFSEVENLEFALAG